MHYWAMILLLIGAYLIGSVPTAYIAGRLLKGIDIRNYGSGIASGSNAWHSISKWSIIPVGAFDLLKGIAPVLIAMQLHLTVNGSGVVAQGVAALTAMIGHSWSIFFKFHGGRGVTPMLGALGVMMPWGLIIFVAIWVGGLAAFKNSPLWMLAGMLAAIISAPFIPTNAAFKFMSSSQPHMMMLILVGMLILLIIKRITAERPIPKEHWKEVLLCRLLYDRDTRNREAWIYRKPIDGEQSGQK